MNQVAINCFVVFVTIFRAILGFTHRYTFYPGSTQLPRVKLDKTVWRFYPPTLMLIPNHYATNPQQVQVHKTAVTSNPQKSL